jgi:RimJ/RimL family protein N-acetyltransferase
MNIRKAESTEKDCRLVFNLSNDPVVRANSFRTEKIEYTSHLQWYENVVIDHNLLFFLIFEKDDFVGQIRFKRGFEYAAECVISLSIAEQFRGKGIALAFLKLGMTEMKKNWGGIKSIAAEVKVENTASNKLFESAGFRKVEAGIINIYKLDIK